MRVQQHSPRVQNGPVAKRQIRSKASAVSKAFGVSKSPSRGSRSSSNRGSNRRSNRAMSHHQYRAQRGSKIMWMMVIAGTILAAGFIFALRSQINTYKLGQAEEELRARLDEYAAHQKYLMVDQQRALSATESERASKQAGLIPLKLNQPDEMRNSAPASASAVKKPSMTQKASSPGRLIQAKERRQPAGQAAKTKRGADKERQIARARQRR